MIKWPGRHHDLPQPVAEAPEQSDSQPIDPHAFMADQERRLEASADAWRSIAQQSKEREEGYADHIRQGLIDVWEANSNGSPLPAASILDRDTEELATKLSVYCLLAARHFSADGIRWGIQNRIQEHFLEIPNHTVNYIIRSHGFPTRRFLMRQVWMANEMAEADNTAGAVLDDLTSTYRERPDDIAALAGLYEDGADEADGRYAELKQIVATDWYRPDPENSKLRQFCADLQNAPHAYAPEFVSMVSDAERNQRWSTVRGMARFAIIATGGNPEDPAEIENMLKNTYGRWDEVQDIDNPFRSFVQNKVDTLVSQFNIIAGSCTAKNIRAYPSADQVAKFKDYFGVTYAPDRNSRRKAARAAVKTHRADQLPDAASIDRAARIESIRERKPRRIMAVVKRGGFFDIEDSSVDGVVEKFKISNEGNLAEDVRNMLAWLRLNPISSASERVTQDAGVRLIFNGSPVKLWRFAPNRTPEVGVRNANKDWRIVYGLAKNQDVVIINDIIDHDAFDKKYK